MIKPTKFLNLDTCLLSIVKDILEILLQNKSISYNQLYDSLKIKYDEDFEYLFLPSLDFLFLLGKLNYVPSSDSLELVV